MQTFHVVHHETGKLATLFEVDHQKPLNFNISGQSIFNPRRSRNAQYKMRVSDPKFFPGLVAKAAKEGSTPLKLIFDDGSKVDYNVSVANGRLFLENHAHSLAVLDLINGSDEPDDVQAFALDPVTTVAIVAIIAITVIAVTDNGGSFSGTAQSEAGSVSVDADGGDNSGNNDGGGDEEGK